EFRRVLFRSRIGVVLKILFFGEQFFIGSDDRPRTTITLVVIFLSVHTAHKSEKIFMLRIGDKPKHVERYGNSVRLNHRDENGELASTILNYDFYRNNATQVAEVFGNHVQRTRVIRKIHKFTTERRWWLA